MERSQNWPDLRSSISKFRDIRFIDTGTDINRWKFQGDRSFGVAMTNIQSFSEERSLDVTWWPDLEWPGSEIFTKFAEKMHKQLCQKRRRSAPPFSSYRWKTWKGVFKHPPPARRGIYFILWGGTKTGNEKFNTETSALPPYTLVWVWGL